MRRRRLLASLVAMALVGAAAPNVAAAAWTAPVTLSATGVALDPQVAVDADGDAVFTWERYDGSDYRIQARARSAAGALSPVQTLSAAGQDAFDPQVAVDGAGNAIFTWSRSDGSNSRIQARRRTAGGALSPIQNLSAAGQHANSPQVAVDSAGNAIFTWARLDGSDPFPPPFCCFLIQARKRGAGGALGPVQTLSAAGRNSYDPQIGVDGNGNAIFTWARNDGTNTRIQARKRTAGGALGAVQTLSAAGQSASPQVGINGAGNAVFTWYYRSDGTYERIQARARSAAGALSPIQTLSAAGSYYPQVGVDDAGNALIGWWDASNPRAQARKRSASGALGLILTLSAPGQPAGGALVAVQGNGDAVFVWQRFDGTNPGFCCQRVQAQTRGAGGALGSVQTLSPAGQDGGFPQVAVNDAGDAVATWLFRSDGTSFVVQAAAGP